MKIHIHAGDHTLSRAQRAQVERQLELELARFGDRVRGVTVRVSKGGAPRGAVELKCQLDVAMAPKIVHVEQTEPDLRTALAGAVPRVARDVARLLERENWSPP